MQVRVAAAQARVHLCDPTLDAILSAAMNSKAPVDTMPSAQHEDVVMRDDAALPEGEASEAVDPMKCKDIHSGEGSFCCQAQAAALSAAAHRLSALHAAHIVAVGRKRSATAAGLQLTEDGGPPEVAVAALSPMLSMHAVPALRHEAFKALNASAGQEPSLMHLATAANSDATTRARLWPPIVYSQPPAKCSLCIAATRPLDLHPLVYAIVHCHALSWTFSV